MKYEQIVEQFSWDKVLDYFDWNAKEKFNFAHETVDRWVKDKPEKIAIHLEDKDGNTQTWTFKQLQEKSNQAANLLRTYGIEKGDRVAGLLGKDMELIVTVLATWKIGAIYVPLFTAFERDALSHRLSDSGTKLLITNKEQVEKVDKEKFKDLQYILIDEEFEGGLSFWDYVNTFSKEHETEATSLDDPYVIQYTSGTTGLPKGATWAHKILASIYPYQKYAMGTGDEDIFLGGADLGWAYGLIQCTFAPLAFGASVVVYNGPFDVEKTYEIFDKYGVTAFAHAPTAYRLMAAQGDELVKKYNIKVKKFNSAGEPISGDVIRFFKRNFGREVYDHYGSTEMGMIVNNYNATDMKLKLGSMGLPSPGYTVELLDDSGNPVKQGEVGEIAVDATAFSFYFLGYWNNEEQTKEKIRGKWYFSGDLASKDEDGYFWFQGRKDDVILSAGYRIGPTEVEDSLMGHPAVQEVAVVGEPDEIKGELVKAYVVLIDSYKDKASDDLKEELSQFVKGKLSKHQYPRIIEFIDELPKTQSGKIQRFKLKNLSSAK